jgi:geranylgeranyl diphosphate synthase, type I
METAFIKFLNHKRDFYHRLIENELVRFWKSSSLDKQIRIKDLKNIFSFIPAALGRPSFDFFDARSKKLRPILGLLIMRALGLKQTEKFEKFLILPEILHSSSLIIDDIEDNATTRRNAPCLHIKYGIDVAVNVANAVYFLPFTYIMRSAIPQNYKIKVYSLLIKSMNRMHLGQGLDILWHKNQIWSISPNQYLAMAKLKTSSFFRAEAELAVLFSKTNNVVAGKSRRFAENVGVAFQIIDDALDLTVNKQESKLFGKRFAQDITEGKKTLLVIYALKRASAKDKKELIKILDLHTWNNSLINTAIGIIKKYSCITDAKLYAEKLIQESWDDFSTALAPSKSKDYLQLFCHFIIKRRF